MSRKTVSCFEILGDSYPVYDGMNIIGRDLEASIIIKNLKISKKHAIISVLGNKHYITDLKSSNGCSLKGEALIPFKFYEIQNRSEVILGDLIGTYHIESSLLNTSKSDEVVFLKPKVPEHFNFAATQQIIEVPKINVTHDDTHTAATQIMNNDNIESTNTSNTNNVSRLLQINDKINDSNEIILCDDSLNDNLDESFAKVTFEESIEIPSTQECFSKPIEDSINDSTVIPCTQDVSFEGLPLRSAKKSLKVTQNTQDCETQINDEDSDATDTEISHDDVADDVCISIKKYTPEPTENINPISENNPNADKTDMSDDEIDFCEISGSDIMAEENHSNVENISNPSIITSDINTTKTSCLDDLDQNINEYDFKNSSIKSKDIASNQNDSCENIPDTEDFEFNLDVIPSTQDDDEEKNSKVSLNKIDFMAQTKLSPNKTVFMAPTQLISNENKPPVEENLNDDKFLAATQILDISALENKTEFKKPVAKKSKRNTQNESINDEDDVNFLASTQEMLNSTTNSETQSHGLDYYSSQEIDGIPEITAFQDDIVRDNDDYVAPTEVLENEDEVQKYDLEPSKVNHEDDEFSAPTQILDTSKLKLAHPNLSDSTKEVTKKQVDYSAPTQILEKEQLKVVTEKHNIDYSAPTQILDNPFVKSNLSKESDPAKNNNSVFLTKSTKNQPADLVEKQLDTLNSTKNGSGTNQKYIDVDFSAPTQKLNKNFDDGDNEYFIGPTQLFQPKPNELGNKISLTDLFMAPTQELSLPREVMNKGKFTATYSQLARTVDDEIFLAPTQELMNNSIKTTRIDEIREEIEDSDDSDIVIQKKRPKLIKETQEVVLDSDSDSEIGYKHKKPKQIIETQEVQKTLSNITKSCADDSAIVIPELDDTEESIRLVLSNTSMNISSKSSNTSTQLEINLPTEKEYFVSQNIRPKNPLLQILSSEDNKNNSETTISQYEPQIGSTAALNLFSNLLNDGLEPTQIVNDLDEVVNIPDSDPEDYDQFCDMETQPIGDVFSEDPPNDKTKKKSLESSKNTTKRKSKQNADIFVNPTAIPPRRTARKGGNKAGSSESNIERDVTTRDKRKIKPKIKEDTVNSKTNDNSTSENASIDDDSVSTRTKRKAVKPNLKDDATVKTRKQSESTSESMAKSTRGRKVQTEKETNVEDKPSTSKSKKTDKVSVPIKRSTRASSVSKEETLLQLQPSTSTKRSTRKTAVLNEETEDNITAKRSGRKTLPAVQEKTTKQARSSESKELILSLTRLDETKNSNKNEINIDAQKTKGKTGKEEKTKKQTKASKNKELAVNVNNEEEESRDSSDEEVFEVNIEAQKTKGKTVLKDKPKKQPKGSENETLDEDMPIDRSKKGKSIKTRSTVEEKTDLNTKNTRRKGAGDTEESNDEKENKKSSQATRKKVKSDSFSLDETPTKKLKTNLDNIPASTSSPRRDTRLRHKVVFTMLDDTNLEATITRLGGTIVNSSQECTVLVTSKISRSLKFLVAVSLGKPIVGPQWVKACSSSYKFVDPWDHILNDSETEQKFNFRLRDAIIKGQKTRLLEGYTCLLLVSKNMDVLKNVIEASGGTCLTRAPAKAADYIVISYPEDKTKYAKYLKQKPPVNVFGAEAIFAGALQQKLMFDEHVLK